MSTITDCYTSFVRTPVLLAEYTTRRGGAPPAADAGFSEGQLFEQEATAHPGTERHQAAWPAHPGPHDRPRPTCSSARRCCPRTSRRGWTGSRRPAAFPGTAWRPASGWTPGSCNAGGTIRRPAGTLCLASSASALGSLVGCTCCCPTTCPRLGRAAASRDGFPTSNETTKEESI